MWFSMRAAILAERVASPLLDHYLAARGVSGQQDDEPVTRERRDNLYEPVPGDHGAHGRFDAEARPFSLHLWATMHRGALALGALAFPASWAACPFHPKRCGSRMTLVADRRLVIRSGADDETRDS